MIKLYKKIMCFSLILFIILLQLSVQSVFAAFDDSYLTWDGRPATLREISTNLGYGNDMLDASGNYQPFYYAAAKDLWERGLMLGSDGTFNLDKPLTRTEGVIMTLRLLGKEQEALNARLPCQFRDVPEWAQYQVAYAAANGITSGYSETVFGAGDTMSANQYITFVLRAMGYRDNIDFTWDKAAEFALEINLIGKPCKEQYMRSNLFLRDNVAIISYNALFRAKANDGTALGDVIVTRRPEGTLPYATLNDRTAAENARQEEIPDSPASDSSDTNVAFGKPSGLTVIFNYTSGILTSANAKYILIVNDNYSGPIEITITAGSGRTTHTVNVAGRGTYNLSYIFYIDAARETVIPGTPARQIITGTDPITGAPRYTIVPGTPEIRVPATPISNRITITSGNSSFTDNISITGNIVGVSAN